MPVRSVACSGATRPAIASGSHPGRYCRTRGSPWTAARATRVQAARPVPRRLGPQARCRPVVTEFPSERTVVPRKGHSHRPWPGIAASRRSPRPWSFVEPDLVDDSGAMTAMSASGDDQPPEVTAGLPPSAAHSSAGMPAGPLPEGARCLTQFIWLLEHVQDAVTWHRQQARSGSYERTAFGTTNRLDRSPRPVSRSRPCAHNDLSVRPQRRDRPTGLARIAAGVCALAANQLQSLSVIGTPLRRVPYRCSYASSRDSRDIFRISFPGVLKDGEQRVLLGCGQDREGPLG